MKNYYSIILFAFIGLNNLLIGQPSISSFSPLTGLPGTTVNIIGNNFNTTPANNIVFFGATKATVNAATDSSLNVTVPPNAYYQYISVTDTTTQLTTYSPQPFNVTSTFCATSTFFTTNLPITTVMGVLNVSITDIDGDGKTDLISVCNGVGGPGSHGILSVIRNTGTIGYISFAAKVDFVTGIYPVSIAIGDLDGDGKPDIAVANSDSDTVSVFKNTSTTGTISFAPVLNFPTGNKPYCVSINDLNNDGKPDLIVTNVHGNSVSVFQNKCIGDTIIFAPRIDFVTSNDPYSFAVGDLDGDNKPDLAIANMVSGTISILKNTSIGDTVSFAARVDYPSGTSPYVVLMGDIDLDGKIDLAVANSGSNTVSVLRNMSTTGNISFAGKIDFNTAASPLGVSIGDLDGDGKPDLVTSNLNSHTVSVLKNNSFIDSLSFAAHVDFTSANIGWGTDRIGDLDGDGKPELIIGGGNLEVIKNECETNILTLTEFSSEVVIYPNPFNASATVQLPRETESADLTIYNSYGQAVKNIIANGDKINIERDNLPSGIYFYKLFQNGTFTLAGKLMIAD